MQTLADLLDGRDSLPASLRDAVDQLAAAELAKGFGRDEATCTSFYGLRPERHAGVRCWGHQTQTEAHDRTRA